MSEAQTIVNAISAQLSDYSGLSSVRSFATNEYELDLVREGSFPWVNVKARGVRVTNADNQRLYDVERRLYTIVITFAVRKKKKSTAVSDAWDLFESIRDGLEADRTFSSHVNTAPLIPEVAVDAAIYESGKFWVGRGAMTFSAYRDHFLR